MNVLTAIVLIACSVAVVTDVTRRRIPNALTLSFAAVALSLHALQGWQSMAVSAGVLVAVLALGFVAFSFKLLGGGDVKLAAAAAAALGYPDALAFLIYTSLGGGLLALGFAATQGRLVDVLRSTFAIVQPLPIPGLPVATARPSLRLPYACAIALGAYAVAFSHTIAPFLRLPL